MPRGVYKRTEEHRRKMSEAKKGDKNPAKRLEVRRKLSESQKGAKGSGWKGGVTPINKIIRKSIEFRLWREAVFARDNWVCQKCGKRNGSHHPHHILNFADYIELRFVVGNGITFCKECHKEFHDKYGYRKNTRQQIEEFIGLNRES